MSIIANYDPNSNLLSIRNLLSEIPDLPNLTTKHLKVTLWGQDELLITVSGYSREDSKRLIDKVADTTSGRRENYGRPLINFLRIALSWDDHLRSKGKIAEDKAIDPADVAYLMMLLKIARLEHSWNEDSLLDIMGYADCLDDINRHLQELGYRRGIDDLCMMTRGELGALRNRLVAS